MMIVELITAGTEILLGCRPNTSAAYAALRCAEMGFSCHHQSIVGEEEEALKDSLETAYGRADIILMIGGAGKSDSITRNVVGRLLGKPLQDSDFIINNKGKHILLLPEAEQELKSLFDKEVVDYLRRLEPAAGYAQTVKTCGITLEQAKELTLDLMEEQGNPIFSFMEKPSEVSVKVLARGETEKEAKKIVKPYIKELGIRFGENLYATEEEATLEEDVVRQLIEREFTIATAESCTGGLLAGRLVNVAGISEVFKIGHITYSNKAKRKLLGVKKTTLVKYGAVSQETAREMAKGLMAATKSEVTVSVTGIAGPEGGSQEKPVGLVYIACNIRGKITVREYRLQGNREDIREDAVAEALILIRRCMLEYRSDEQK